MPAVKKLVGIPEVPKHIAAANAASTGGAANMFESFIPKQEEDPAAKLAMDKVQVRLNLFFPCSFPSPRLASFLPRFLLYFLILSVMKGARIWKWVKSDAENRTDRLFLLRCPVSVSPLRSLFVPVRLPASLSL